MRPGARLVRRRRSCRGFRQGFRVRGHMPAAHPLWRLLVPAQLCARITYCWRSGLGSQRRGLLGLVTQGGALALVFWARQGLVLFW